LTPPVSPTGQVAETSGHGGFLPRQVGQAPTLLDQPCAIIRIVHVGQPQHSRAQPALALIGAMAGDRFAGGCPGFHMLRVTLDGISSSGYLGARIGGVGCFGVIAGLQVSDGRPFDRGALLQLHRNNNGAPDSGCFRRIIRMAGTTPGHSQ
jgi:hypothetical protein